LLLGQHGEFSRPARGRGQRQTHHRVAAGVGLDRARRIGVLRQRRGNAGQRIADVICSTVQVDARAEFQRDRRAPQSRTGRNLANAADSADRAFDHRRHLAVHHLGCRTGIGGRNADHRVLDGWKLADFETSKGRQSRERNQCRQNERKDRPVDKAA
jgi:hypothetical protein